MKPGGCNRSHIPKALEHLTGLPNPQSSQEPPAPGPHRHPSHTSQMAQWKNKILNRGEEREGMPRYAKLQLNPQRHTNRATNTLQPHGTTTHVLTKKAAGQSQPQGFNDHMTAANATGRTKTLTNTYTKKLLTRLAPSHKLYQTLQSAPNAKQTLTDDQDTNNRLQKRY